MLPRSIGLLSGRSSNPRMNFHSPGSTGVIDSRLPFCSTRIALKLRVAAQLLDAQRSASCARSFTSTLNQRGFSGVAAGS